MNFVKFIIEGSTSKARLINLMRRTDYWLITLFLMIVNLRLWFYVGSLNSYLEFMSDNNEDTGKLCSLGNCGII